jgi:hypothetical protein
MGWNESGWIYGKKGVSIGKSMQIYGHYVTDHITTLLFHDNYCHDTDGMALAVGGGDGNYTSGSAPYYYDFIGTTYFYNNIITQDGKYYDGSSGPSTLLMKISSAQSWGGTGGNWYFFNNTLVNKTANSPLGLGSQNMATFKNNIIQDAGSSLYSYCEIPGGGYCDNATNITGDYNLWYGAGTGKSPIWDTSALTSNDPLFTNQVNNNFTLQPSSPAVSTGANLSSIFTTDFLGTPRSGSGPWDIGAIAYASGGGSLDTTPPEGSISINNGARTTNSASVSLSLSASDPSGVSEMKIANTNNIASVAAEAYNAITSWVLSAGDGVKTVYAWFADTLGNWMTSPVTASITLDTTPPTISLTSPASNIRPLLNRCKIFRWKPYGSEGFHILISERRVLCYSLGNKNAPFGAERIL